MPIINGIEYIDAPEVTSDMDTYISPSAIFTTDGMTRRQLIEDAKKLAGNSDSTKG